MRARNMRKAELRRFFGVAQLQGERMVDFLYTSKQEVLEAALAKFGLRLKVWAVALNPPL